MASKTLRIGSLGAFAVLIAVGLAIAPTQYARAATSLTCTDTGTGNDVTDVAPIAIGTSIACTSSTGNPSAAFSTTTVTDGTGAVVASNSGVGATAAIAFATTNAGVWHVEVRYFTPTGLVADVELVNIVVSFLVIPESGVGAIALVGSSIAALGAFMGIRGRKLAIPTKA